MSKRALLIGIDRYNNFQSLTGCVADATAMHGLLNWHEDGSQNFACRLLTSDDPQQITRAVLRSEWRNLFGQFSGEVLLYYSGHGAPSDTGGYLVTQDGTSTEPGLPMNELLQLAMQSNAREILIILDCCFAGDIGTVPNSYLPGGSAMTHLRQGMTILAAAGAHELAKELGGHGVFTNLVLGALAGGAADVRGRVSAAGIYSYVEEALGPWDQRPLYKSFATSLSPIRLTKPYVADEMLRELPRLFSKPDVEYHLDPSYEFTHKTSDVKNIQIFDKFKQFRDARLLRTVKREDLYFAALNSNPVELTPLGQFYWRLVKKGLL